MVVYPRFFIVVPPLSMCNDWLQSNETHLDAPKMCVCVRVFFFLRIWITVFHCYDVLQKHSYRIEHVQTPNHGAPTTNIDGYIFLSKGPDVSAGTLDNGSVCVVDKNVGSVGLVQTMFEVKTMFEVRLGKLREA